MGSAARSFSVHFLRDVVVLTDSHSTVLAGGTFPGPLIQGNLVRLISELTRTTI
jgi:hypothetical protein